jgi:hypothetical protein
VIVFVVVFDGINRLISFCELNTKGCILLKKFNQTIHN